MSTTISILGGVGLFLLGMTVMTGGLRALAGSGLRTLLGKAAGTPLRGAFWGGVVTLLVQSSSATTMTTIGLVSAGLLTFPQGLGFVFGANVGTTATGWLVALIGVRVSLTAAALPMIFVGALIKLLGRGRVSGAGAALAGFALVLFGLTTLQQGMGGLAEWLHPADLPAVLAGPGAGWWLGLFGVLALVVVGLVMTAVMQSSTAAIAVTLSAHYAGAVGLDQACALIIGQNIGTATSSAMAAIGASTTAKRLALAYILFKLIAALIALVLYPGCHPAPDPRLKNHRRSDAAGGLPHGIQRRRCLSAAAGDQQVHAFSRAHSARARLAPHALPRPRSARDSNRGRGSGAADGGAHARVGVRIDRRGAGGREPRGIDPLW
jgi:phosphate:Na+ symporter